MSAFEASFGKIGDTTFKASLLPYLGAKRKEVLVGPAFGVDASVIELGNGQALAVTSDPLSLIPALGMKASAWLSVQLMANDLATTGCAPQYAQFVLNLPPSLSLQAFEEYWQYIHQFCQEIGVAITGGHTGQVAGQESTLPGGGSMFLTAPRDKILTSQGARPGDLLIVTKEAALSASSILARCFPETVKNRLGEAAYQQARGNFYRTSSLQEALLATQVLQPQQEISAMHDVTEGGLLGALVEMAKAADCGVCVKHEQLPLSPVVQEVCKLFSLDPFHCIGAGAMLMAVQSGQEEKLISHLANHQIEATVVGQFTAAEEGHCLIKEGKTSPIQLPEKDPYWNAFFTALHQGWR